MDGRPDVVVVGAASLPTERRMLDAVVATIGGAGAWVWGPFLGVESRPLPLTAAVVVVCTREVRKAFADNPEEVHALFWHSETRGLLGGLPGEPSVYAVLADGASFDRVPEAVRHLPVVRWPSEREVLLEALRLSAPTPAAPAAAPAAAPPGAPVPAPPPRSAAAEPTDPRLVEPDLPTAEVARPAPPVARPAPAVARPIPDPAGVDEWSPVPLPRSLSTDQTVPRPPPAGARPAEPAEATAWTAPLAELVAQVAAIPGFALLPVELADAEVAGALANALRRAGQDVRVWLPGQRPWKNLPGWLDAAEPGQRRVMLAFGPAELPDDARAALGVVDRRSPERHAETGGPLVWCGPADGMDALAQAAPRLWATRAPRARLPTALAVTGAFTVRLPRPPAPPLDLGNLLKRWELSRGFPATVSLPEVVLALLARDAPGDVARAHEVWTSTRVAPDRRPATRLVGARLLLERGDLDEAERVAAELVAEGNPQARAGAVLIGATARLLRGELSPADLSREVAALPRAERAGTLPVEALLLLGRHWAVTGDLPNARGAFVSAASQAEGLGAAWLAGEARADLARLDRFLAG